MLISNLTFSELQKKLKSAEGLCFQAGPFDFSVRSSILELAAHIYNLYGDFPLSCADSIIDYHVSLERPLGLRRWYRPKVIFKFDNTEPFKPLPFQQCFAMFEWGLNYCISNTAHQYLILHSAVVEKDGQAIILPAPPGAGKSTLCSVLINSGWRLLSDELALISRETGLIHPLSRPVCLKNQSIDVIQNHFPSVEFGGVALDTAKGTVSHMKPLKKSVDDFTNTVKPEWVIFPKYVKDSEIAFESFDKASTFMELIENAFNYELLGAEGFRVLSEVVDRCQCYNFRYSNIDEAIKLFKNLGCQ